MSRINITSGGSIMDAVLLVAENNPGALRVVMDSIAKGEKIDPQNFTGKLGVLFDLDYHEIYGHRIWCLYKDVCGENLSKMIAMLRAAQLGFLAPEKLQHAIDNRGDGIDVGALAQQVQERLPQFVLEDR